MNRLRPFSLLRPLSALLLCSLLAGAASAQNPQEPPPPGAAIIRSRVLMVNLFVTARQGGEYVRDLKKEDFTIQEDGKPQEIRYFNNLNASKDVPLTIVLLVDTSGSVSDKLPQEAATASAFLRQILRPGKDLAAIFEFQSEVALIEDFTADQDKLDKALKRLRPGGNTALFDAVYLAAEEKLRGEAGRKVIVILSDGDDTSSRVKANEAIKAAQKSDVVIFGMGIRSQNTPTRFDILEKFCRNTGGRFFNPSRSIEDLRQTFDEILADINHQYNIAYASQNQNRDGGYRKIKVKVARSGVKLSVRDGYFAPEN